MVGLWSALRGWSGRRPGYEAGERVSLPSQIHGRKDDDLRDHDERKYSRADLLFGNDDDPEMPEGLQRNCNCSSVDGQHEGSVERKTDDPADAQLDEERDDR